MYIDYLEGNLDKESVWEFANQFAIDDEFRDGFKSYILITSAISSNIKSFGPSINETSEIYKKLGYSIPVAILPTTIVPTNKSSFFQSAAFKNIMICLCSSALTLATIFLPGILYKPYISQNQPISQINVPNTVVAMQSMGSTDITVSEKAKQTYKKAYCDRKIEQEPPIESSKNNTESNLLVENDIQTDQVDSGSKRRQIFSLSEEPLAVQKQLHLNTINNSGYNSNYQPLFDTCFFIRKYDSRFRFEFKNTPSWFSKSPTIQPYQLNDFNNLSVTILYPLYKTLILGADFRQETFYVEYEGINEKGQNLIYHQKPNLSTFSLLLRYIPFDFTENFRPFGQILLGGNKTGSISRGMIGIEYYPFEYVYFQLGGELNQFYFTHNSKWFNANKYSLNYGIGVKF